VHSFTAGIFFSAAHILVARKLPHFQITNNSAREPVGGFGILDCIVGSFVN